MRFIAFSTVVLSLMMAGCAPAPGASGAAEEALSSGGGNSGTQLVFRQEPTSILAGQRMSPAVSVAVEDASGRVVPVALLVTLSTSVALQGASAMTVQGIATFPTLTSTTKAFGLQLTAKAPTDSRLTPAVSTAFNVAAAAPYQLAFQPPPGAVQADQVMAPVAAQVWDIYGNLVGRSNAPVTLSLSASPVFALLSGTTSSVADAGVAIFADLSVDPAGLGYELTAESSGLVSATATFDVSGPGAGKIVPADGDAGYDANWPDGQRCTTLVADAGALVAAVNGGSAGDVVCLEGELRISEPLRPKANMTLIGIDTNARISGGAVLSPWVPVHGGVSKYVGPFAAQRNQNALLSGTAGSADAIYTCYDYSTYEDQLFYRPAGTHLDQPMARVTVYGDLFGPITTPGQRLTAVEQGLFYSDFTGAIAGDGKPAIYAAFPAGGEVDITNQAASAPVSPNGMPALIAGAGVNGVSLKNVFVEKSVGSGIYAGTSWRLQDVTARFSSFAGVLRGSGTASAPFVMADVLFTQNGNTGVSPGQYTTVTHSELSWNNLANHRESATNGVAGHPSNANCGGYWSAGAGKTVARGPGSLAQPNVLFTAIDSHHNVGDGMWTDVGAQYVTFDSSQGPSRYHHNERWGLKSESSCWISINGVELDHNGALPLKNTDVVGGGIQVIASTDNHVTGNTLHDNALAIDVGYAAKHPNMSLMNCIQQPVADDDNSGADRGNVVQNNDIYLCSGLAGQMGGTGTAGGTMASRGNTLTGNAYHVQDTVGDWWMDVNAVESWSSWQNAGYDTTSAPTTPCTFP